MKDPKLHLEHKEYISINMNENIKELDKYLDDGIIKSFYLQNVAVYIFDWDGIEQERWSGNLEVYMEAPDDSERDVYYKELIEDRIEYRLAMYLTDGEIYRKTSSACEMEKMEYNEYIVSFPTFYFGVSKQATVYIAQNYECGGYLIKCKRQDDAIALGKWLFLMDSLPWDENISEVEKKLGLFKQEIGKNKENFTSNNDNVLEKSDPYEELKKLVGLDNIKKDVTDMANVMKMQLRRQQQGLKVIPFSLHLVFSGNPGTGKTTIARILARIYKDIGILSKGQLVEVDRSGLVAGYVGQTALKTQEKINEALGGILFIDEAYTLAKDGNDYGQEAIDTILKAMEDHRNDFVVIVAGYSELMHKFINSNPGLKSRFNKYMEFPDYSANELVQIFLSMCNEYGFVLSDEAYLSMKQIIATMETNKEDNFANARDIRNLFEKVITKQATRLVRDEDSNIMELIKEDFEEI